MPSRNRRGRRPRSRPFLITSSKGGKVLLLKDFTIDYLQRRAGFIYEEIDRADAPPEAFYMGLEPTTKMVMLILPEARQKLAAYNLSIAKDPYWKTDPSYFWTGKRKEGANA